MPYYTGIKVAVLDYFQIVTNETKSCLIYLSCFCLCAVYESADDMVCYVIVHLECRSLYSCMSL